MEVLKFFEESGEDDMWVYYDILEGYSASWKHEEVSVIAISKDCQSAATGILRDTKYTIHTTERGELEATEDAINNLVVYRLVRVH